MDCLSGKVFTCVTKFLNPVQLSEIIDNCEKGISYYLHSSNKFKLKCPTYTCSAGDID